MNNITEINRISNRILGRKYEILEIGNVCEIGRRFPEVSLFSGCHRRFEGYAHDDKRREYRLRLEDLGTVKHTIKACIHCHDAIEFSSELTDLIFSILRPEGFVEPMVKITEKTKAKLKGNKPAYFALHKCKHCHYLVRGWLCSHCGEVSV